MYNIVKSYRYNLLYLLARFVAASTKELRGS